MKQLILVILRKIYSIVGNLPLISDLKEVIFEKYLFFRSFFYRNTFIRSKGEDGINFLGLIKAEIGLGQSSRLIIDAIDYSRLRYSLTDFDFINFVGTNDLMWAHQITNEFNFNINLIHLNAPELILAHLYYKNSRWKNKYNIGFWLWELEEFPQEWLPALNFLDEIWTPSIFISNSLKRYTQKPILTVPYPLYIEVDEDYNRDYFAIDKDTFVFITLFDFNSTLSRKNPFAAIEAFKQTFNENENVLLILKVNNPNELDSIKLEKAINRHQNIRVLNRTLSRIEVNSLINVSDVLVSLHRAEGFGLTLAEAMCLGKPTIATNWSANTEFMNESNSCLVDYDLVEIEETQQFYQKGFHWAEPKIQHASDYMFKLYSDPVFYQQIGQAAYEYMKKEFTLEKSSNIIKSRIQEIYAQGE